MVTRQRQRALQHAGHAVGLGNQVDIVPVVKRTGLATGHRSLVQLRATGGERAARRAPLRIRAGEAGRRGLGAGRELGALRRRERVLVLVVDETEDVELVFGQVALAEATADFVGLAARILRAGELGGEFDAFVVLAGDEVDHAADRIRAVQGRGTVAQHFDAFDCSQRDRVQVGRRAVARSADGLIGDPAAVQQDQRLVGTESAQVGERRTAGNPTHGRAGAGQRLIAGDGVHDVFDSGVALLPQLFHPDDGDWQSRLGIDPLDRGAGDLNAFQAGSSGLRSGAGRDHEGRSAAQCRQRCTDNQALSELVGVGFHR